VCKCRPHSLDVTILQGSDKSFVAKVDSMNKDSPCWYREKAWPDTDFGIVHYAGKVVYDATNMVTKVRKKRLLGVGDLVGMNNLCLTSLPS
jgi:myosin heavy subunit